MAPSNDREQIIRLLQTARGQIDGILSMIDQNRYCMDISNQVLAVQGLLTKANKMIVANHLNSCVRHAFLSGDEADQKQKIEEIIGILDKIAK
jgi:DNA-binding FrmR family transcriptional regulator